ncbi:MAG TPA: alpha/beta hydrolase family protein [Elusimicrobiales bacterium]|nr:alpha/beta hydrolase family protein [Elusimicrobiales bacterium]
MRITQITASLARTAFTAFAGALLASQLPAMAAGAAAPDFSSGNGINVLGAAWLPGSERTVVVDIATPLISPNAVNGGAHQVVITLPAGYADKPAKRYPVLYLLHGGNGGSARTWTAGGGDAESVTKDFELITVMPDGGKVGWYTDWVDESAGAQKWETFHTKQLIAWVDANLRTNPDKKGRAIAGLSMGGYGALHYAYRHPDLFSYVGSFSGAADLQERGTRLVIWQQSIANGMPSAGAFGPTDGGNWDAHNPLKNAENASTRRNDASLTSDRMLPMAYSQVTTVT